MNTLAHIAPQLPPAIDGVGDYCWNLWKHWPQPRPAMKFLALRGADATQVFWNDVAVASFQPCAAALHSVLEQARAETVVLHYVGYGYQPKGIPLWLPEAMERWRGEARNNSRRLVTMFHEMYATSSPLRSPFWVAPWARQIIARLVRASDLWVTSCDRYFDWLADEFDAEIRRGRRAPVGSNVPGAAEAKEDRLWPFEFGRKLRVAIFGLPNTRLWTLQRHWRLLQKLVEADLLEHVLLVGKSNSAPKYVSSLKTFQKRIGGLWRSAFDLPPHRIAEELAECHIGMVANDAGTITKSGVFAAMASNGLVCIASNRDGYALRSPLQQCVLLNDDALKNIPALVAELRGNNRMTARRRLTLQMAEADLSWSRIAAAWNEWLAPHDDADVKRVADVAPASDQQSAVSAPMAWDGGVRA